MVECSKYMSIWEWKKDTLFQKIVQLFAYIYANIALTELIFRWWDRVDVTRVFAYRKKKKQKDDKTEPRFELGFGSPKVYSAQIFLTNSEKHRK